VSYILDALRRAEAERRQGQVPGLHAGDAADPVATDTEPRGSLRWPVPAALAGLAVLGAAVGWAWLRPVPNLPAVPMVPVVPAVPAVASAASPPAAAAPEATAAPPQPAPAPPLPIVVSAPPPPPAPSLASAPAPVAATGPDKPLRFSQLSPDQQRQMPPLVPSGHVWSEQPANRFVMFNGQLVREGDTVAPGLVLERLLPKAAWLRWRGQLIEVPL
jgi:general secretion pathway protein B